MKSPLRLPQGAIPGVLGNDPSGARSGAAKTRGGEKRNPGESELREQLKRVGELFGDELLLSAGKLSSTRHFRVTAVTEYESELSGV